MASHKNASTPNFWLVLVGLLLLIGLIGGSAVALNEAGIISATTIAEGSGQSRNPPDFDSEGAADSANFSQPSGRSEHEGQGESNFAFLELGISVGKIAMTVAIVYYAQKVFGWLEKRFSKPELHNLSV